MDNFEKYLMDKSLSLSYDVLQNDIDILWNGIIEYNSIIGPMLKYPPYEPYRIILKNKSNKIIAGILCKIYLKSIFVDLLWISEEFRKEGIGSILLKKAEEYGKSLGCKFVHLDTFSFQAIEFYKKYNYEIFGCLDDYPDGIKRYFLKKNL
jgi:GNAT superfamily N-acetyltransferase